MKKDCVYQAKCYSHGSSLNLAGEELVCNDGRWEKEPDTPRPELTIAPGEGMSDI